MLCEFLVEQGYAVETALDGQAALDKLDAIAVDLVVTDYEMPGMSGAELIRLVHERHPGQPALLVTAREGCPLPGADDAACGPVACLQKPVDLDDLTVAVRRLIEDSARPDDVRRETVAAR